MPYAVFVEERIVLCDKGTNARRRPAGDSRDIVRETITTVSGVEAGHGQEMFKEMLGQIVPAHFLVTPLIERHIEVRDGSTECVGVLRRDARRRWRMALAETVA